LDCSMFCFPWDRSTAVDWNTFVFSLSPLSRPYRSVSHIAYSIWHHVMSPDVTWCQLCFVTYRTVWSTLCQVLMIHSYMLVAGPRKSMQFEMVCWTARSTLHDGVRSSRRLDSWMPTSHKWFSSGHGRLYRISWSPINACSRSAAL